MNLSKGYLLLLALALGALSVALVRPFLPYFLMALLLAFVLLPLQRRLASRTGPGISSFLLIVGATIALIIPFLVMVATIAGDALQLATRIQDGEIDLGTLEQSIESYIGMDVDLAAVIGGSIEDAVELLVGEAPTIVGAVTHMLVGIGLAVFLLFFLLKDGDHLAGWLRTVTPLPDDVQDDLYENVSNVTSAVLLGHVVVAIIQGSIAGIGLFVVGIPNAIFWTFMMIVLALLPAIGAFLVWGPASFYLVFTGDVVPGVLLFVYGAIVVSVTDEFLRPLIVDRRAKLNPSIIIIGVIGGMYFLGVMGLFFGPIILGALKVTLEVFDEHYHDLESTS